MSSKRKQTEAPAFEEALVPVADLPAPTGEVEYLTRATAEEMAPPPLVLRGSDSTSVEVSEYEHAVLTKWLFPRTVKSVVRDAAGAVTVTAEPGGMKRTVAP